MFTGSAKELKEAKRLARQKAEKVIDLLNEIHDLGLCTPQGQIMIPGVGMASPKSGRWGLYLR